MSSSSSNQARYQQGQDQGHGHDYGRASSTEYQQNPTFPSSRPSLPHPSSVNINMNNNNNSPNSSSSPTSSSASNRHWSHSNNNNNCNLNLHSTNTHLGNSNNYNNNNNDDGNNNGNSNNPSGGIDNSRQIGPTKPISGPGGSSFSQLPPLPHPSQLLQQQQLRSDDYYSLPSPMTPQSKGGQYPSPTYQQSPYQPQHEQPQPQQRYPPMNQSYQQQQFQQPYSGGYPFQQQQQQYSSFPRALPSPSVSLSSDEYLMQRDYQSGGSLSSSTTGRSRHGQSSSEQPSVEDTSPSPSRSDSDSSLRFKVTLDAQTAAMQHQGDTPSTYLNKGQFYTIAIQDTERYDGDVYSVVRIAFHEEAHRKLAARYWSFWLSQQSSPKTARALDIEKASSTGMLEVQSKMFDRTQFKWNGKEGARLMIRFNCLSTDFSRIKGVKGIPLRVQIETYEINYGGDHSGIGGGGRGGSDGSRGRIMEKSFAKIKLFRDKGAERKNKDDQKHLEKMWDKMRGKNADTNPLSQVLAPVQHVSLFWECPGDEEDYSLDENEVAAGGSSSDGNRDGDGDGGSSNQGDDGANREESSSSSSMDYFNQQQQGSSGGSADGIEYDDQQQQQDGMSKRRRMNDGRLDPNPSAGYRGSDFGGTGAGGGGGGRLAAFGHTNTSNNNNSNDDGPPSSELLDRDPSYIPQQRKKKLVAMLCLYIKIGSESVYRAIYLERPTLHELLHKLCEKLEIQASTISGVFRKTTKKSLLVRADDAMVAQMPEELDMEVEYEFNQQDGSVNLTLKY